MPKGPAEDVQVTAFPPQTEARVPQQRIARRKSVNISPVHAARRGVVSEKKPRWNSNSPASTAVSQAQTPQNVNIRTQPAQTTAALPLALALDVSGDKEVLVQDVGRDIVLVQQPMSPTEKVKIANMKGTASLIQRGGGEKPGSPSTRPRSASGRAGAAPARSRIEELQLQLKGSIASAVPHSFSTPSPPKSKTRSSKLPPDQSTTKSLALSPGNRNRGSYQVTVLSSAGTERKSKAGAGANASIDEGKCNFFPVGEVVDENASIKIANAVERVEGSVSLSVEPESRTALSSLRHGSPAPIHKAVADEGASGIYYPPCADGPLDSAASTAVEPTPSISIPETEPEVVASTEADSATENATDVVAEEGRAGSQEEEEETTELSSGGESPETKASPNPSARPRRTALLKTATSGAEVIVDIEPKLRKKSLLSLNKKHKGWSLVRAALVPSRSRLVSADADDLSGSAAVVAQGQSSTEPIDVPADESNIDHTSEPSRADFSVAQDTTSIAVGDTVSPGEDCYSQPDKVMDVDMADYGSD